MKLDVRKSFEKDITRVSDKGLAVALANVIDALENCESLSEISHIKKMSGNGNYYRIRVGNYRLGFKVSEQTLVLLRFMNRKDIYKYFP